MKQTKQTTEITDCEIDEMCVQLNTLEDVIKSTKTIRTKMCMESQAYYSKRWKND